MADTGSGRIDPFADVISFVAGPIAASIRSFDQLRRGAEELIRGLENFNSTMENLNETAARVNRLLNDYEEPIRAMLPQLTRTIKLADEMSMRLATPIDQVVPGLSRLAETLNSPIMRSMPTDLGQFMEIINDVGRRMSPLAQMAEQAGNLFGLRLPGLGSRQSSPSLAPAATTAPAPSAPSASAPFPRTTTAKKTAARKAPANKTTAAKKRSATTSTAKKSAAKKRAAAKR
jgi:ABC-type transporter Mla subunit MlaD